MKGIAENKHVDNILLLSGKEGLRRYNSWSFGNDADRRNAAVIWEKFLEQIEPQVKFRIARFCLQRYSQKETENIDDFLARSRLQAQKCKFRDEREMEERIIDQIIAGTKFPELQKQLLSKNEAMSIWEVLNICRSYEASINHMRQMDELQGKCDNQISAIKHRLEDTDNCGKCGLKNKNGNCPAWGSTCSACGCKNHWARMCHNEKLKKKTTKNGQAATDEQVCQTKKKNRTSAVCT